MISRRMRRRSRKSSVYPASSASSLPEPNSRCLRPIWGRRRGARLQLPGTDQSPGESRGCFPCADRPHVARHMSSTLTAFRALVRKDVVIFLRDRRALMVSVLTPIVVAAFFGSLFGGGGGDNVWRVPVGVTDLDGSVFSKAVVEDLAHDQSLATELMPGERAHQLVKTGKLRAAIVIPAGFGAAVPGALLGGTDKPSVKLIYD